MAILNPNEKYYVIAGNYDEAMFFAKKKLNEYWDGPTITGIIPGLSMSNFVYVRDENTLTGVRNPKGFFYGSWMDRKDLMKIFQALVVTFVGYSMPDSLNEAYKLAMVQPASKYYGN